MNLIKSTSTFGFYTIISRLFGYLRDILIAIFLGTGLLADVFFVAFRIPNTFRRLFSEGTFNAAFVPSYSSQILKGIALFPGGAKYIGDFKDFKPHGYGNFAWTNGDKYFGEWKNGKSHGNGTKIWKDGREYSGSFENDKLHGVGTFYYPDGKKYKGAFINGKRHGKGTFT